MKRGTDDDSALSFPRQPGFYHRLSDSGGNCASFSFSKASQKSPVAPLGAGCPAAGGPLLLGKFLQPDSENRGGFGPNRQHSDFPPRTFRDAGSNGNRSCPCRYSPAGAFPRSPPRRLSGIRRTGFLHRPKRHGKWTSRGLHPPVASGRSGNAYLLPRCIFAAAEKTLRQSAAGWKCVPLRRNPRSLPPGAVPAPHLPAL